MPEPIGLCVHCGNDVHTLLLVKRFKGETIYSEMEDFCNDCGMVDPHEIAYPVPPEMAPEDLRDNDPEAYGIFDLIGDFRALGGSMEVPVTYLELIGA